jgi:hypothetical protein
VIRNKDNPTIVLELLANRRFKFCQITRLPNFYGQVREKMSIIPSDNLNVEMNGTNVVHVAHNLEFTNILMSTYAGKIMLEIFTRKIIGC